MGAGRTRVNGVGRQQKQHKRAATSFQDKLAVIRHYEASRDMQATVRQFYPELDESGRRAKARVVYRWLQLKDTIAAHAHSAKTKNQSRIRHVGSATTLGAEGEQLLVAWLQQMRRSNEQVSSERLRARAMEVAKARGVPDGAFAASGTWQKSFLKRNKAHLRDKADGDGDGGDSATEDHGNGVEYSSGVSASSSDEPPVAATAAVVSDRQRNDEPNRDAPQRDGAPRKATESPVAEPRQLVSQPSHPAQAAASTSVQPAALSQPATNPAPVLASVSAPVSAPVAVAPAVAIAPLFPPPAAAVASQQPLFTTPVKTLTAAGSAAASPAVAIHESLADAEEREMKKRKAEIEDRKAELLNESIRCDNVLKKIRIAEENMLARKRLKDAGIPQDEIDLMLPIQRQ